VSPTDLAQALHRAGDEVWALAQAPDSTKQKALASRIHELAREALKSETHPEERCDHDPPGDL
jgi:hypothetical protein